MSRQIRAPSRAPELRFQPVAESRSMSTSSACRGLSSERALDVAGDRLSNTPLISPRAVLLIFLVQDPGTAPSAASLWHQTLAGTSFRTFVLQSQSDTLLPARVLCLSLAVRNGYPDLSQLNQEDHLMARSVRRHPITGHTKAPSDRPGKRLASRRLRAAVRRKLRTGDGELLPHARELGSVWTFPKDGKVWCGDQPRSSLRLVLRK